MKIIVNVFLVMVFTLVTGHGIAQGMSKKELRAQQKQIEYQEVVALVQNDCIEFVADRAFPTGYKTVDLTTNPNSLKLSADSAFVSLPYFGRSFSADYGGRGGIHFEGEMLEKKIDFNEKKMKLSIHFVVKENDKTYTCDLVVFHNNTASLSVNASNLQVITYDGSIKKWVSY